MRYLLQHILDESAQRAPDSAAFRFDGADLTYGSLSQRSDALAETLHGVGVARGDRVGIHLRKGLRVPQAVYGIVKAGAAFVPLDPQLPARRLATIVRSAGIRKIVTDDALPSVLGDVIKGGSDIDVLVGPPNAGSVDTVTWSEVDGVTSPIRPAPGLMQEDMAYLMFTSGSTGVPKGIIHTHASGLCFASTAADVYDVRSDDRLSGFPPLHFDQALFDFFSGPLAGATTVIVPEAHMMLPVSLSSLIESERLTIWYSVPYALIQLLERGALDKRDLSSLRWVLFGGEVFPVPQLKRLMEMWPHARFSNVYGPAEVNQCTLYHVPPPSEWSSDLDALPLGVVWPNAEGIVLGGDGHILQDGQEGEFAVRTPATMQGYWTDSSNPDAIFYERTRDGGRIETFYRTGDLVRKDRDGLYRFLGRMDRQIKSRGFRIELDEIEAAFTRHPAVAEAAAYALDDESGSKQVFAAVRVNGTEGPEIEDLRTFLAGMLPSYAIPSRIRILDDFPRTTSGKIDRRVLAAEHVRDSSRSVSEQKTT